MRRLRFPLPFGVSSCENASERPRMVHSSPAHRRLPAAFGSLLQPSAILILCGCALVQSETVRAANRPVQPTVNQVSTGWTRSSQDTHASIDPAKNTISSASFASVPPAPSASIRPLSFFHASSWFFGILHQISSDRPRWAQFHILACSLHSCCPGSPPYGPDT
jgi:hypothetical protein